MRRWVGVAALVGSFIGLIAFRVVGAEGLEWERDPVGETLLALAFLSFPAVGALISWRRPDNAMGLVFSAIGLLVGIGGTAQAYAEGRFLDAASPGAIGYLAAWISNWWWYPLLGLVMVFTTYLFPTGRPLTRRWRIPFLAGATAMASVTVAGMLAPRLEATNDRGEFLYDLDNPIGVSFLGGPEEGPLAAVAFPVLVVSVVIGVLSLIVRAKRSRGVERQQLKWFAVGGVFLGGNLVAEAVFQVSEESSATFALAIGALPVAAGIAILRYRLYDIDVVINRALVYGTLTAILGGVYVGTVFALQELLAPVTARNDLAIAASTFAVAALFGPVRRRVQAFIDRRFYRGKVDAQRTIEQFNSHLRDEVELTAVTSGLVDVVRETMRPAHVSLWLRKAAS